MKNFQNILPFSNNKYYNQIYKNIEEDFIKAKNSNVDYIIVLAYMGKEFNHGTNSFQNKWNKILSNLGTDFILGVHVHDIEPLKIINNTFIVNAPGNFSNLYIKKMEM